MCKGSGCFITPIHVNVQSLLDKNVKVRTVYLMQEKI